MSFLDMKTVLFSYILSNAIILVVIGSFWWLNRNKFKGIGFWVADYWLQLISIFVLVLRGIIPVSLSILLATPLSLLGTFLLFYGLEQYTGKPGKHLHNYAIMAGFMIVHMYFAFVKPSLQVRNINFSFALLLLSVQIAWLMLHRVSNSERTGVQALGWVFIGYSAFSMFRIVADVIVSRPLELFSSSAYDVSAILAYQMLSIVLTFSLSLMVNRNLLSELENDIVERQRIVETLRTSEEKFALAFKTSPYALLITRMEDGKLIEVNQAFYNITGFSPEDSLDSTTLDLALWVNSDDRKEVVTALMNRKKVLSKEYQFRCKDGGIITCLFSSDLLMLNSEVCILSSIADISARIEAENAVRELNEKLEVRVHERTAELESSMLELESFSYTVSHDLRAPLRAINGFSNILTEDYRHVLDAEAIRICSVISNNARDMGKQIDDLLAFTQLGRAALNPTRTDMGAMVRAIVTKLMSSQERMRTSFSIEPLPEVVCDADLMRQVWMNLIGNALKFSSKEPVSIISIKAVQNTKEILFSISDNGIGVDMRFADKLFGVFQRLHSAQGFEGKGMGLAIVHRIILKHGGRTWLEGEPGKGVTVFFTLKI